MNILLAQQEKAQLFQSFKETWGKQYETYIEILKFLRTYNSLFTETLKISIIPHEIIETSIADYIYFYTKLENCMDFLNIKQHCLPIEEEYDLFIDISSKHFPIIDKTYHLFEPFWIVSTVYETIDDFIHDLDTYKPLELKEKLHNARSKLSFEILNNNTSKFDDRTVFTYPIIDTYFLLDNEERECERSQGSLILKKVNVCILHTLPPTLPVQIKQIKALQLPNFDYNAYVQNIQKMLDLLRVIGMSDIVAFELSMPENQGNIMYYDNTLTIQSNNEELFDKILYNFTRKIDKNDMFLYEEKKESDKRNLE